MTNKILDVCGEVCPMPVVRTRDTLNEMNPGEILEVIVDYPPSRENVQRFAKNDGHKILEVTEEEANIIKIVIQKV